MNSGTVGPGDPTDGTWDPVQGNYFAYIDAGFGAGVYSMLSQAFFAAAGELLSFSVFHDTADYVPFTDDSKVTLTNVDTNTSTVLYSMNTQTTGDYGGNGWTPINYVFGLSGNYQLLAEIRNTNDNALSPTLGLDGPSAAPVPEPGTMALLGSGLVGLVGAARKRYRAQRWR